MNDYSSIIFTTVSVNLNSRKKDYIKKGIKLVDSVVNNSKYRIVVLTNDSDSFDTYKNNSQVIIKDLNKLNIKPYTVYENRFNMHLKRHALEMASIYNSNYIIYLDCDGYLTNKWDDIFSLTLFDKLGGDVYRNSIYSIAGKRDRVDSKGREFNWKIVTDFLWDDFFCKKCYAPQETHIVFKNNEKFKIFNEIWEQVEKKTYELNITSTNNIGFVIGLSICKSGMNNIFYKSPGESWQKYFSGLGLNHLGKETKIISGV
jgi:hypothetical protein